MGLNTVGCMSPGRGCSCWPPCQPTGGRSSPCGSWGCGVAATCYPGGWEHVLCSSPQVFMPLHSSSNYGGSTRGGWGQPAPGDAFAHEHGRLQPCLPNEPGLRPLSTGRATKLRKHLMAPEMEEKVLRSQASTSMVPRSVLSHGEASPGVHLLEEKGCWFDSQATCQKATQAGFSEPTL